MTSKRILSAAWLCSKIESLKLKSASIFRRTPPRKRFKVKARNIVFPPDMNTDKTEDMLEFLEGPEHR